ncbi:MAG: carbamoyltransferase family protein [Promethearchaeota archaeon]
MNILGISCFYHDSAACLVRDGEIIAAAQEERFTRKKHDPEFPKNAIEFCLRQGDIDINDVDVVAFYDKPFLKFERILETYLAYVPFGIKSFLVSMPSWIKKKFWMSQLIKKELGYEGKIIYTEHHQSHAGSAFYPSPFKEAAFLTVDGVGEWTTASFGIGKNNKIEIFSEINFPHSLGLLYSAFTYYTGFKVNSGEYKVMGLAPYGEAKYVDLIKEHLIDIKDDGSFKMNMDYFDYAVGLAMTNEKFHKLFGGPPRKPESKLTQKEMDLAKSLQEVTEEIMSKMAYYVHKVTGQKFLCLAGGVALNCVANGRILREGPFDDIWIQPASGDAGGALGAALCAWHQYFGNERKVVSGKDSQRGSLLGPEYTHKEIKEFLDKNKIPYQEIKNEDKLLDLVSDLLIDENVVGWFQGKMEFGPRALGSRSILADARSPKMQKTLNLKIKFRESFRPFAPSILAEKVGDFFEMDRPSPYMLLTVYVREDKRRKLTKEEEKLWGIDKLNIVRSVIPAVTHVDYSARLQTVHKETNPRYHKLIEIFYKKTSCPVIVNTSFNVRGEPIVCTPSNAYKCFMRTKMDYLVMGNFVLDKKKQPDFQDTEDWRKIYELD